MTIKEALKICNKNTKVLVAIQNLEDSEDDEVIFIKKRRGEYGSIFKDAKTIRSINDSFVREMSVFTEKQDLHNIRPKGLHKIILMLE